MSSAPLLSELLARETERTIAKLDAAIAAVEDWRKWQTIEDERFAEFFQGNRHGNSVRAAERAVGTRMYAAIDLVFPLGREFERIAEDSADVSSDECLAALREVREEQATRLATLRGGA